MMNKNALWLCVFLVLGLIMILGQVSGYTFLTHWLSGNDVSAHSVHVTEKTPPAKNLNLKITAPTDQQDRVADSCRATFWNHPLTDSIFDGLHFNDQQRAEFREKYGKYFTITNDTVEYIPELSSSKVDTWYIILRAEIQSYTFYIQCIQSLYKDSNEIKNIAFVSMDSYYLVKYGMQFFKRFASNFVKKITQHMDKIILESVNEE